MAELYASSLFTDSGLKGYWRMESNWNDSSPSGYTLTANNSPTFVAGKFGNAGNFVLSSSQSASIAQASAANINITGSQSWGCWVNQATLTSYQAAMGWRNSAGSVSRYILTSADAGGVVYFTIGGLTTNIQVASTGVLTTGVWYFLVGVYDSVATKLRIYINGVKDNEVTASGSGTAISDGGFAVGASWNTANYTNGSVDDAFIFNRVLTDAEILSLYQAGAQLKTGRFWGA